MLLDAKRGDIGSTMDAYADYLRSDHPLQVDAMTVSPYLGPESLEPARSTAQRFGGGLFVLARTSNPDAGTFQHAVPRATRERTVAQARRRHRARLEHPRLGGRRPDADDRRRPGRRGAPGAGRPARTASSSGATLPELDVDLDSLGGPILAPGLGAQGGSPADLRRLFGRDRAVVPTVSRGVLGAGADPAALRAAADRWTAELAG